MVLYNHADKLPEALESLLSQTYRDFRLLLVDDTSTDATPEIARRYAAIDSRVTYLPNKRRRGMIGNWRHALEIARATFPDAPYFAWASDHDLWHPRWLELLVAELEQHPEVVLVYPYGVRVSDSGTWVSNARGEWWRFDTFGLCDPSERLVHAVKGMSAGSMVYGLFRADALRPEMVHYVYIPDRLLMSELSLYGQFKQVPLPLYYRRYGGEVTLARQLAGMYPGRKRPLLYLRLPWWIVHFLVLFRELVLRGAGLPRVSRGYGASMAVTYLWVTSQYVAARSYRVLNKNLNNALNLHIGLPVKHLHKKLRRNFINYQNRFVKRRGIFARRNFGIPFGSSRFRRP